MQLLQADRGFRLRYCDSGGKCCPGIEKTNELPIYDSPLTSKPRAGIDDSYSVGDKRNSLTTSSNELAPVYGTVFTSGLPQFGLPQVLMNDNGQSRRSVAVASDLPSVSYLVSSLWPRWKTRQVTTFLSADRETIALRKQQKLRPSFSLL
jgi:hypothetical protein